MKSDENAVPLTQKQIAERLGVSRQLVGFALRGEGRMTDEVRGKIVEFARQHGYDPNANREARLMVARRYGKRVACGILAVLFPATFEEQPLSSVPFFMPFFQGLEDEAISRGVDLALCALRPDALPRLVRENQVDGVICLLTPDEPALRIRELGLPVVSIQYEIAGIPSLTIDDRGGSAEATRHLIALGHRRIAYLGLDNRIGRERLAGFREAMRQGGVAILEKLIDVGLERTTVQAGAVAMRRMLERGAEAGFSAVLCFNDLIAMGAVRALEEDGRRVPVDVSVVGFDDVAPQYGFSPALTSVGFSRREMGRRAVQLLCEQEPPAGVERFFTLLVARDSCAPPRRKGEI